MHILKLLIVDDELGVRLGTARSLKNFTFIPKDFDEEVSFEIQNTGTGKEALAIMESNGIDIVLIDYKLPDIDGLEILNTIKKKHYNLLSIFMTAYATLDVAVCATKSGAYDFLAKPFSPEELKHSLKKASSRIILQNKARKYEEEKKLIRFEFLSVLSHELKAPLNAVESYLRIMDSRLAGDTIENYEKMIKRSLDRISGMRKLIFDLLDLTRIESGQKRRTVTSFNLVDAAMKSIEIHNTLAKNKDITISLKSEEIVMVNADQGEMEIMFNNLISNAIKYNKIHGSVILSISKLEDTVSIEIEDTGIGFKEEEKTKIFKEFVRCKNELTQGIEGSGLGLSILSKLTKLYNGSISVESEFGKGSKFTIRLKQYNPST